MSQNMKNIMHPGAINLHQLTCFILSNAIVLLLILHAPLNLLAEQLSLKDQGVSLLRPIVKRPSTSIFDRLQLATIGQNHVKSANLMQSEFLTHENPLSSRRPTIVNKPIQQDMTMGLSAIPSSNDISRVPSPVFSRWQLNGQQHRLSGSDTNDVQQNDYRMNKESQQQHHNMVRDNLDLIDSNLLIGDNTSSMPIGKLRPSDYNPLNDILRTELDNVEADLSKSCPLLASDQSVVIRQYLDRLTTNLHRRLADRGDGDEALQMFSQLASKLNLNPAENSVLMGILNSDPSLSGKIESESAIAKKQQPVMKDVSYHKVVRGLKDLLKPKGRRSSSSDILQASSEADQPIIEAGGEEFEENDHLDNDNKSVVHRRWTPDYDLLLESLPGEQIDMAQRAALRSIWPVIKSNNNDQKQYADQNGSDGSDQKKSFFDDDENEDTKQEYTVVTRHLYQGFDVFINTAHHLEKLEHLPIVGEKVRQLREMGLNMVEYVKALKRLEREYINMDTDEQPTIVAKFHLKWLATLILTVYAGSHNVQICNLEEAVFRLFWFLVTEISTRIIKCGVATTLWDSVANNHAAILAATTAAI